MARDERSVHVSRLASDRTLWPCVQQQALDHAIEALWHTGRAIILLLVMILLVVVFPNASLLPQPYGRWPVVSGAIALVLMFVWRTMSSQSNYFKAKDLTQRSDEAKTAAELG